MTPYLILIFISFIFCFIAKKKRKHILIIGSGNEVSNNNFAVPIFFFLFWLLLACRSVKIGNDTANYKYYFASLSKQSFTKIFGGEIEILFSLLNWSIGKLTDSFQIYLAIIAAITVIPIAVLYMQDRRHSYLKIILFVNMSVFVMLFSGLRQAIAMSIGLIAFYFVKKKKLILFLITVFIAMGFHSSAFILFAMYPLYYIRLKNKHLWFILPIIATVYIFNEDIFEELLKLMTLMGSRFDDTEITQTGAVTMIILFFMFTLFAYIIPDDQKADDEFIGMRNYLLLSMILQCFAPLHFLAMRMNYYYILFVPVVVTMSLNYAANKWKKVAKFAEIIMCVFFTGYFVMGLISSMKTGGVLHTVPYIPFWAS